MSSTSGVGGARRGSDPVHQGGHSAEGTAGAAGAIAALARRMGLSTGEALEILERLPYGEIDGAEIPEAWRRPVARQALERYAARKRAVTRLAARDQL